MTQEKAHCRKDQRQTGFINLMDDLDISRDPSHRYLENSST
jgi:hypothetical protein